MKKILTIGLLLAASQAMMAQGTAADYKRAFDAYKLFSRDKLVGNVEDAHWTDANTIAYSVRNSEGKLDKKEWKAPQTQTQTQTQPPRPPKGGDNKEGDGRERGRWGRHGQHQGEGITPPANIGKATTNGPQLLKNHWMNVDEEREGQPALSPDSTQWAYVRDFNVWVCDRDGKHAKQLSFDGALSHYYSAYLMWSPDSKYIAVNKIRPVEKRYVYYVESSPATQTQPILHQQEYAKPGDEVQQKYPCVFEVATGKAIIPSNELFPTPYEIRGPEWTPDGSAITFEYNERGHKVFRVLSMDVQTGQVSTIVEEKSPKYINYNRYFRQYINDGKQMLWMSERDNWTHLYLIQIPQAQTPQPPKGGDNKSGAKNKKHSGVVSPLGGSRGLFQITKGEWVVREVLKVDEENQTIYFTASGVNKDEDPYLIHYYKIGLDGKNMMDLTPGNGNHKAQFNEDYTYLVDTYSRVDEAPVTVVRSVANPNECTELGRVDLTKLKETGWQMPEVFTAPGRDGKTPMWGVVWRPSNFDPSKKYPVIEYIYAGPGDAYTPKSFGAYSWVASSLCELGFVVVQLDAMGTSYRGKAFEEVCYKNLKDAGFPDRIAWIKALAQKYPYLDLDNVGIFGCSAGGQESTTAVLLHGDFYKAAYSACGCHDNRMDKIWWNEQWMGYPVDSSYVECSNVTNAHLLKGALMLVVGECDDNVDPASTMQVANALIKANKNFELVVIPGAHHTMGEEFGDHKRYDFFVKNLLHKDPPAWSEVGK